MLSRFPGVSWQDGIEGNAIDIASIDHTPLRVLAGPGTGKTFALKRRVWRLLSQQTDPSRIFVCTFTRTAARDLEKELREMEVPGINQVWASTIHSFCFNVLNKAGAFAWTNRTPRPLLKFEERFLLEDLKNSEFGGIRICQERMDAFNAAWARLQSEEPGWPSDPVDRRFQDTLINWLIFHKAILIGELVPLTLNYIKENPLCDEKRQFDHIIVDEYQDLNRAEQQLLDLLSETGNLCIVGDEDQSIYSFKYAHPEGIANFQDSHANTLDKSLDECRRCPHLIVEMANTLIGFNDSRSNRNLLTRNENPYGEVLNLQWETMEQEAEGISEIIRHKISSGQVEPGRVLILAPRKQIGYAIRDKLNDIGVAAHSFFHEEIIEGNPTQFSESEAQRVFTLLTYLSNPEDRIAIRSWIGYGSPSLRKGAWSRIRKYCEEENVSPKITLDRMIQNEISIPRTTKIIERYIELTELYNSYHSLRGTNLLNSLFSQVSDWSEPFRLIAENHFGTNDDYDANDLKELLYQSITQPELPTDVDYVRVMSLHKSKGLTADLVVVMGCVSGLIPHRDNALEGNALRRYLEEQRRLFYVSITRTKKILVLSNFRYVPRNLAYRMRVPLARERRPGYSEVIASPFLGELGSSRPNAIAGKAYLRSLAHV